MPLAWKKDTTNHEWKINRIDHTPMNKYVKRKNDLHNVVIIGLPMYYNSYLQFKYGKI